MATRVITQTFDSDLEGMSDAGNSSNIAASFEGSDGSPSAGCLKIVHNSGLSSEETEYVRNPTADTSWEDLGFAQSGETVTKVQITACKYKKIPYPSSVDFPGIFTDLYIRIVDSGGSNVLDEDLLVVHAIASSGSWSGLPAGTQRNVLSGKQSSTTGVRIEIQDTSTQADTTLYIDSIEYTVTYTPAAILAHTGAAAAETPHSTPSASSIVAAHISNANAVSLAASSSIDAAVPAAVSVAEAVSLTSAVSDNANASIPASVAMATAEIPNSSVSASASITSSSPVLFTALAEALGVYAVHPDHIRTIALSRFRGWLLIYRNTNTSRVWVERYNSDGSIDAAPLPNSNGIGNVVADDVSFGAFRHAEKNECVEVIFSSAGTLRRFRSYDEGDSWAEYAL